MWWFDYIAVIWYLIIEELLLFLERILIGSSSELNLLRIIIYWWSKFLPEKTETKTTITCKRPKEPLSKVRMLISKLVSEPCWSQTNLIRKGRRSSAKLPRTPSSRMGTARLQSQHLLSQKLSKVQWTWQELKPLPTLQRRQLTRNRQLCYPRVPAQTLPTRM